MGWISHVFFIGRVVGEVAQQLEVLLEGYELNWRELDATLVAELPPQLGVEILAQIIQDVDLHHRIKQRLFGHKVRPSSILDVYPGRQNLANLTLVFAIYISNRYPHHLMLLFRRLTVVSKVGWTSG